MSPAVPAATAAIAAAAAAAAAALLTLGVIITGASAASLPPSHVSLTSVTPAPSVPTAAAASASPPAGDECAGRADGPVASAGGGCRRFAVCVGGAVAARRVCAAGTLFDGRACVPADLHSCAEPRDPPGPCAGLPDGFYGAPDEVSGCREYVYCVGGSAAVRAQCEAGLAWNGTACAAPEGGSGGGAWACVAPQPWPACRALPPGLHPDLAPRASCAAYFQCAQGNRTLFRCPEGKAFDAARRACFPRGEAATACSATSADDPCAGAADGYRAEPGSGCRSYFYCAAGHKITYVCPAGQAFDGQACAPAGRVRCAETAVGDCAGRPDGYHPDAASACRRYFFCLGGARVIALACPAGRVFDGRRCVERGVCRAAPAAGAVPPRAAAQVSLMSSPDDESAAESAPGTVADCGGRSNGFYQDLGAGCKRYFFCIEGRKTSLACPPDQVFDGQLCVDAQTYACPVLTPPASPPAENAD